MARPVHRGPDLLDLLAEAEKPGPVPDPPEQVCTHGVFDRMRTGGAVFHQGRWVHATCQLPMNTREHERFLRGAS